MRAPAILFCNNNGWAISTPRVRADARADARRQGGRLRDPGGARRRRRRARRLRGDARRGRARACRRRPDASSRPSRTAPRRTPRPTTRRAYIDPERVEEARANECVGRFERLPPPARRCSPTSSSSEIREEALASMRAGIAAAEAEPTPDPGAALRARLRRSAGVVRRRPRGAAEDPGDMAERFLVEAVNDALHVEMERDENGDGDGRGRRAAPAASSAPPPGFATASAPTAASTRRSPRPASSAPRSASAWPAGGRCARCSTTPSRTPASTS